MKTRSGSRETDSVTDPKQAKTPDPKPCIYLHNKYWSQPLQYTFIKWDSRTKNKPLEKGITKANVIERRSVKNWLFYYLGKMDY